MQELIPKIENLNQEFFTFCNSPSPIRDHSVYLPSTPLIHLEIYKILRRNIHYSC